MKERRRDKQEGLNEEWTRPGTMGSVGMVGGDGGIRNAADDA